MTQPGPETQLGGGGGGIIVEGRTPAWHDRTDVPVGGEGWSEGEHRGTDDGSAGWREAEVSHTGQEPGSDRAGINDLH